MIFKKVQIIYLYLFFASISNIGAQDVGHENFYQYQKLRNQAVFKYFCADLDSAIYLYESAFKIHEPRLFDQYYCALSYAKLGAVEDSKRLIEAIVKKGYPVTEIVSNKIFADIGILNSSFVELLHNHHESFLLVNKGDLYLELQKRVSSDIQARNSCSIPNCDVWKRIVNDNIEYLREYTIINGLPCERNIGYAIMYVNFILLHGKSEESFTFFDPILKSAVMTACFPTDNYAYWFDGNRVSVLDTTEVFGTVSLLQYRNNGSLPDSVVVSEIESARKSVGMQSFKNEVMLIKLIKNGTHINK